MKSFLSKYLAHIFIILIMIYVLLIMLSSPSLLHINTIFPTADDVLFSIILSFSFKVCTSLIGLLLLIINLSVIFQPKKVATLTYLYFFISLLFLGFSFFYWPTGTIKTSEETTNKLFMALLIYLKVFIDYIWGYFLLKKIWFDVKPEIVTGNEQS